MRRRPVKPNAVDAREFFPQALHLRSAVCAQTCERGYQSSAAIWGDLIDPLAAVRGTDTFAGTRGVMKSKRRIKINGRGGAGDPFMILRAHLGAFRRIVRRGFEPGQVYGFEQFLL